MRARPLPRRRPGRGRSSRAGDGDRQADDLRLEELERRGLDVPGEAPGRPDAGGELLQLGGIFDAGARAPPRLRCAQARRPSSSAGCRTAGGGRARAGSHRSGPGTAAPRRSMSTAGMQAKSSSRRHCSNRSQLAVIFSRSLPSTWSRCSQHRLQAAELFDQLGRGLLADAGDARDVVRGVAGQDQEVDDLLGENAEELLDLVAAQLLFQLGVEDEHPLAHQLEQVLVGGKDQHLAAGGGKAPREQGDDVVALQPRLLQEMDAAPGECRRGRRGAAAPALRGAAGAWPCSRGRARGGSSFPWSRRPPPADRGAVPRSGSPCG